MDDAARRSRLHPARRNDAPTARYEEAVAVARRSGDPLRLAEAEACYDEALALYAAKDEPPTLAYANALRPMAILKEAIGQPDEARLLWQRAKALYAAIPVPAGVAECEDNLARLG